ncbi:hypothetical protein BUE76_19820 [Cnuella takakiae]|nr:hypothetical protein BUE76_19820 [Cnuella takakiae]
MDKCVFGRFGSYKIWMFRVFIAIGFRLMLDQSTSGTKIAAATCHHKGKSALFTTAVNTQQPAAKNVFVRSTHS